MFKYINERGFATLEVILMVTIIGILASIAVPRFTSITASANTAKVQSDLTTLDMAIATYQMEEGKDPSVGDISVLKDYIQDVNDLKPPTGSVYLNSDTPISIPATEYTIADVDGIKRAVCGSDNTAAKFKRTQSSSSGGGSTGS